MTQRGLQLWTLGLRILSVVALGVIGWASLDARLQPHPAPVVLPAGASVACPVGYVCILSKP